MTLGALRKVTRASPESILPAMDAANFITRRLACQDFPSCSPVHSILDIPFKNSAQAALYMQDCGERTSFKAETSSFSRRSAI